MSGTSDTFPNDDWESRLWVDWEELLQSRRELRGKDGELSRPKVAVLKLTSRESSAAEFKFLTSYMDRHFLVTMGFVWVRPANEISLSLITRQNPKGRKMKKTISLAFLGLGIIGTPPPSVAKESAFVFQPTDCILAGDIDGKNQKMKGENIATICTLGALKASENGVNLHQVMCGTSQVSQSEEYEGLIAENVLVLNSKSGNIKLVADLSKRTFSLGSVHLLLEKAAIATKKCIGTF
jgi:hypothetical protein